MLIIFKWAENPLGIAQVFIGGLEEKSTFNLCFEEIVQTKIKLVSCVDLGDQLHMHSTNIC